MSLLGTAVAAAGRSAAAVRAHAHSRRCLLAQPPPHRCFASNPFGFAPSRDESARRLGVDPTASDAELKRAFLMKAKQVHPDTHRLRNSNNPAAMRQAKLDFVELVKAYEHLKSTRGQGGGGRGAQGGFTGFRAGGGRSADDINAEEESPFASRGPRRRGGAFAGSMNRRSALSRSNKGMVHEDDLNLEKYIAELSEELQEALEFAFYGTA